MATTLDQLSSLDVPDTTLWQSLDLEEFILENHHVGRLDLILYWLKQELRHIKIKAVALTASDSTDSRFRMLDMDVKLANLAVFEPNVQAAVDFYISEYAVYRWEMDGVAPPPKGVSLSALTTKQMDEQAKKEAIVAAMDLSKISLHNVEKLFKAERVCNHNLIEKFRESGRFTAAEAVEATADNSKEAQLERWELMSDVEKKYWVLEKEAAHGVSKNVESITKEMERLVMENEGADPDVDLPQIEEDDEDEGEAEGGEEMSGSGGSEWSDEEEGEGEEAMEEEEAEEEEGGQEDLEGNDLEWEEE